MSSETRPSTVYDLIRGRNGELGYVSDLALLETPYQQFDSRLHRCDEPTAYVAGSAAQSGYSWIGECSAQVLFQGKKTACLGGGTEVPVHPRQRRLRSEDMRTAGHPYGGQPFLRTRRGQKGCRVRVTR